MTNGNLINEYWVERFCNIPFKIIAISLDAASKKTYNKIRLMGNFDNILNSIKSINDQKKGKYPEIQLSFIIMKQNLHEILDFIELAHRYDISKISYQTIKNQRFLFYCLENINNNKRRCFDLLKISDKIKDLTDNYDIECVNRIPGDLLYFKPKIFFEYYKIRSSDLNNDRLFKCNRYWQRLDITPEFYNSCCFSIPNKFTFPNNKDQQNLQIKEIWNSEEFIKTRLLLKEQEYDKVCKISCPTYFNYKTKGVLN